MSEISIELDKESIVYALGLHYEFGHCTELMDSLKEELIPDEDLDKVARVFEELWPDILREYLPDFVEECMPKLAEFQRQLDKE